MTGQPIKYLATCVCTEDDEVAFIDDNRPNGGEITIVAPGHWPDKIRGQISIVPIGPDIEGWTPYAVRNAEQTQSERNVTQTVWLDWHSSWTVRCTNCGKQAQMSSRTVEAVADALRRTLDGLERRQTADPSGASTASVRHLIPLGALCRIASRTSRG